MGSHQQPRKHGRDRNEGEIAEAHMVGQSFQATM